MSRRLTLAQKSWPLKEPFVIARGTRTRCDVIVAKLESDGHLGRGEAVGVDYRGETPETMLAQLEAVRAEIEAGAGRRELLELLPAGGARNAIDAALWDLEAKLSGVSVWRAAGVEPARPVATTVTIGIRSIEGYEARARELGDRPWLKVKVSADHPLEAVAAVRRGAPEAHLVVDANQAWSVAQLRALAADLADLGVELLEQPVAVEDDAGLAELDCPVPRPGRPAAAGRGLAARHRLRPRRHEPAVAGALGLSSPAGIARSPRCGGLHPCRIEHAIECVSVQQHPIEYHGSNRSGVRNGFQRIRLE